MGLIPLALDGADSGCITQLGLKRHQVVQRTLMSPIRAAVPMPRVANHRGERSPYQARPGVTCKCDQKRPTCIRGWTPHLRVEFPIPVCFVPADGRESTTLYGRIRTSSVDGGFALSQITAYLSATSGHICSRPSSTDSTLSAKGAITTKS